MRISEDEPSDSREKIYEFEVKMKKNNYDLFKNFYTFL